MGWCGATIIFDTVCENLLDESPRDSVDKKEVLGQLYDILRNQDWDCQYDSDYLHHPIVKQLMIERGDYYDEDDDE